MSVADAGCQVGADASRTRIAIFAGSNCLSAIATAVALASKRSCTLAAAAAYVPLHWIVMPLTTGHPYVGVETPVNVTTGAVPMLHCTNVVEQRESVAGLQACENVKGSRPRNVPDAPW